MLAQELSSSLAAEELRVPAMSDARGSGEREKEA